MPTEDDTQNQQNGPEQPKIEEKTFHERISELEAKIVDLMADRKKSKLWILNAFKKMYLQVKAIECHTHNTHGTAVMPISQTETLVDAGEGIGKSQNENDSKPNTPGF